MEIFFFFFIICKVILIESFLRRDLGGIGKLKVGFDFRIEFGNVEKWRYDKRWKYYYCLDVICGFV